MRKNLNLEQEAIAKANLRNLKRVKKSLQDLTCTYVDCEDCPFYWDTGKKPFHCGILD